MARTEWAKILFRQLEQSHRGPQATAVFSVRRMFEVFLQMNKRTRGLDQSLEKIVVLGVGVEPELLQDVMRFVVALLVPAAKVSAIKWMFRDLTGKISVVAFEVANKP